MSPPHSSITADEGTDTDPSLEEYASEDEDPGEEQEVEEEVEQNEEEEEVEEEVEEEEEEEEEEVEEEEEEVEEEVEVEEVEEEVEEDEVEEEVEEEEVEEEVKEEEVEEEVEEEEVEEEVEEEEVEEEVEEEEVIQEEEEEEVEEEVGEEVEEEEEEEEVEEEVEEEEEEVEYEEEEVEEGVENDEEEEEEDPQQEEVVEKDEDEKEMPGSPPTADEDCKDSNQHKEYEGQEGIPRPVSSGAENHEVIPPSIMHSVEGNDAMLKASVSTCETLTLRKEEFVGDSNQHVESEGQVGNSRPVSSVAENPEVMPPFTMHSMEGRDAMLIASVPTYELLTLNKEEFVGVDSSQQMESEVKEGNSRPVSSVAEIPELKPLSSMLSMEGNDAMFKASVPSCEALTLKKEEFVGDSNRQLESEGQVGNSRPVSSVAENREILPSSSMYSIERNDTMLKESAPSCETLTLKKEEFHPKHEISSHHGSRKNLTSAEESKSRQVLDVDIENAGATRSSSDTKKDVANGLPQRDRSVEGADGGQISRKRNMQLEVESKDDVKQMTSRTTRGLSPSGEMKDGNKRPKIICDFYAKGWCIRGSSCSFLHIKDPVDNTDQEADGDVLTANQKRGLVLEEGVMDNVKRSRKNEQGAGLGWHASHEKPKFPLRESLFSETAFAFNASNNYFSTHLPSYATHAEGMATMRNQHTYNGYTPTTSMALTHRILAQSVSTFSGSEREDLPLGVTPHSSGYISKICSYDWEPSIPFRPSFFITSMSVSSPGDLYDPLRDSIEIPNIGDGSLKASLLIQGSSIQALSQVHAYGDSAVVGKRTSDLLDDKSSVSSHNRLCENETNQSVPHRKDCLKTETETTSGTYINHRNGNMDMGQHISGVKDNTKADKEWTGREARHHGEGSGHKKKRVDRDKKIIEMDVDSQMDGSVQKETKALRNFRAALVDLVKELLRPSWHEGHLSKDAHIMIVKKSVDKVLSTLEPHQIPTTVDTVKHYVSSCRVKIAKLVNGYVNKYAKS